MLSFLRCVAGFSCRVFCCRLLESILFVFIITVQFCAVTKENFFFDSGEKDVDSNRRWEKDIVIYSFVHWIQFFSTNIFTKSNQNCQTVIMWSKKCEYFECANIYFRFYSIRFFFVHFGLVLVCIFTQFLLLTYVQSLICIVLFHSIPFLSIWLRQKKRETHLNTAVELCYLLDLNKYIHSFAHTDSNVLDRFGEYGWMLNIFSILFCILNISEFSRTTFSFVYKLFLIIIIEWVYTAFSLSPFNWRSRIRTEQDAHSA